MIRLILWLIAFCVAYAEFSEVFVGFLDTPDQFRLALIAYGIATYVAFVATTERVKRLLLGSR